MARMAQASGICTCRRFALATPMSRCGSFMAPHARAASNSKLEVGQSYTSFISLAVLFIHPNRDVRIFRQECHSIRLYSNATLLTKSPSLSKRKHHALSVGVMPPEPGLTSHTPASPAPFISTHVPTTTARHFHYQIRS